MIRVNLLGTERAKVRTRTGLSEAQKITIGCAAIMLLAAGYIGYRFWAIQSDQTRLEEELAATEAEAQRLRGVLTEVQRFESQKTALNQRVQLIEQLRASQRGPVHMLDEISRALPDRVWLVEMTQKGDDVTIDGRTNTITSVADFIANLQNSQYFRRPVRLVSNTTDVDAEGEIVRFVLEATFVPGGNALTLPPVGAGTPGTPGSPGAGRGGN